MGEIKSTLDIVLEKTKHLTMGCEEKKNRAQEEVQKKMKGLVQKFQGQAIRLEQLKKEVNHLQTSYELDCRKVLLNEVFDRLDLNQDNGHLISMLNRLYNFDTAALEKELNHSQKEIQLLENRMTGKILQNLSEKFNLSGTAIVPNLENDEVWEKEIGEIQNKFKRMMMNQVKV